MCYDKENDEYYRDAGNWSINYKVIDGIIVAYCIEIPNLHEKELIEISVEEWKKRK